MSLKLLEDLDYIKNSDQTIARAVVDPIVANEDGIISISNGHTSSSVVPDMMYSLNVPASGSQENRLVLNGQTGSPAPAVGVLEYDPVSDGLATPAQFSVIGGNANTSARLNLISNSTSTPQTYTFYAPSTTAGGLIAGHLQLFSYNQASNPIVKVLDITPQAGSSASTTVTLSGNVNIGGNLTVSGSFNGGNEITMLPGGAINDNTATINNSTYTSLTTSVPLAGFTGKLLFDLQGIVSVATPTGWENIEVYATYAKNGGSPVSLSSGSALTAAVYKQSSVRVFGMTTDTFTSSDTCVLTVYAKCQVNSSFSLSTDDATWYGTITQIN